MHKKPDKASQASIVSILVNTVLFGLKYWAGLATGSIAIIADAWHTLSDSVSSIILLFGIRFSKKPADKEHPFGHGRFELITALIIGAILGLIGYNILVSAIEKLQDRTVTHFGFVAKAVTILSILMKEGLAQYSFYIGKKTQNKAVIADGWHHRSDSLSSVIVLIGIFAGSSFWWIDSVLGAIVSLLIFYATYRIFSGAVHKLLGETPDEPTLKKIKDISNSIANRDLYLHHTHIHSYGKHKEITFHIRLPSDMSLDDAHKIATKIERRIMEDLNLQATIHMEPLHEN